MPSQAEPPLSPRPVDAGPRRGPDDPPPEGTVEPSWGPSADGPSTRHVSPHRRRRLFTLLGVVAVLAYASDQLTKLVALDLLDDGRSRPFIGELIRFTLIGNPGAALSLGAGNTWVMTAIAVGVLVAIVVVAKGLGSRVWAVALGMLLGAALGNLTDRFVRPPGGGQGHVVDFIDYNRWFIGNVADIWIVSAAVLIVLLALLGIGVDGVRDRDRRAAEADTDADRADADRSAHRSSDDTSSHA